MCVPNDEVLRNEMLDEGHQSSFSIHPGSVKMYKDLKLLYWWPGMKTAITDYVSRCLTCLKVKVEHQAPTSLFQPLKFPQWKWKRITIDFVSGLPVTPRKNDSVWKALGTRLNLSTAFHPQTNGQSERVIQILEDMLRACVIDFGRNWEKSIPLVEIAYNNSENKVLGPQMIQDTKKQVKIIHHRLKQAFDRLKAYADTKRRDIRYEVGDTLFLNVSPWKKVLRFGKKGKLSPRYIGPFEVLEKVGPVAYRLALPPEFDKIHNFFHVTMLRRYRSDPSHVLEPKEVELNPDLSYEEEPVQILDREVKRLRNKNVSLVKVLWRNHKVEEATWEPEETMRTQYPYLFDSGKNSMTNSLFNGEGIVISSNMPRRILDYD
ncbi:hypothetical protein V6N11_008582 [Hibiscus sabdariffa]|uniref:Integrase catalytic domain-containing protein n=1 Tax=Hibiscus sabdariffa TaxID=183260 RepID=A0ABR2PNQ6_9ROSI